MRFAATKPLILIVGFGNPLRGDDGVGWYVIDRLQHVSFEHSVKMLACHQLMPELVEEVVDAELVIFIDAAVESPPGRIACAAVIAGNMEPCAFTHSITPQQLIGFALHEFEAHPIALLYTIGGDSFLYQEKLSPTVQHAADQLVVRIENLVAWWEGRISDCFDAHLEALSYA
jgi:hydrogenase maturation protease